MIILSSLFLQLLSADILVNPVTSPETQKLSAVPKSSQLEDLQRVYEKYDKYKRNQPKGKDVEGMKGYFASIGDIESVKILIRHGVDFCKTDHDSYYPRDNTPIIIAAQNSHCEMVMLLVDNEATMNPREWFDFMRGTNVLMYDSVPISPQGDLTKRLQALEYLLDRGVPVNRTATYNRFKDDEFYNFSLLPKTLLVHGTTPAEKAYLKSVIQMLLDRGAKLRPSGD